MSSSREAVPWSAERQQQLQQQLVGMWRAEVWTLPALTRTDQPSSRSFSFEGLSPGLQTELKYALWQKYTQGAWKLPCRDSGQFGHLRLLIAWLAQVAPPAHSLLDHPLTHWCRSLESFLTERGQYQCRVHKQLDAYQQEQRYRGSDRKMILFQQLYALVSAAYDVREEQEKERWDLRKLGLKGNPTISNYTLNFTGMEPPWLRQLTKTFLAYRLSICAPGTCRQTLQAIKHFSRFLTERHPTLQAHEIDRACVLSYISYLRAKGLSEGGRRECLGQLRLVLEGCAHQLGITALTKERLIFAEDFPKPPEPLPREIPQEVLEQLREHLAELPTLIMRMVVILLEGGLRISELCTLPLDCLTFDDRHEWYLRFYQLKGKKEHIIPLVDQTVVEVLQAQQAEVSAQWGQACRYLFPSVASEQLPFKQDTFSTRLNAWAFQAGIRDRLGQLYHFTAHQFRHTVGMRLLNEDVPLETISRLLGHTSLAMTQRYARKRAAKVREELQRVFLRRKTIDFQGQVVRGEPGANGLEPQLLRRGIRGQTLPVGG
jgi:integrase